MYCIDVNWLTRFMPCLIVFIQLCFELLPASSSRCTWSPPSMAYTFLCPDPFTKCSLVVLFLCSLALSTVAPAWQCCHHVFSVCLFKPVSRCAKHTLWSIKNASLYLSITLANWHCPAGHPRTTLDTAVHWRILYRHLQSGDGSVRTWAVTVARRPSS